MKNRVFVMLLVVCMGLSILLSGCDQTQYTVRFDGNYPGCQEMASMTVTSGKKLAQVDVPVREGYVFLGWYTDAGLTNAWDLQISREGVATAVLSLPLRYMHTPVETIHRTDLDNTAALLAEFVRGIGKEVPDYAL